MRKILLGFMLIYSSTLLAVPILDWSPTDGIITITTVDTSTGGGTLGDLFDRVIARLVDRLNATLPPADLQQLLPTLQHIVVSLESLVNRGGGAMQPPTEPPGNTVTVFLPAG